MIGVEVLQEAGGWGGSVGRQCQPRRCSIASALGIKPAMSWILHSFGAHAWSIHGVGL